MQDTTESKDDVKLVIQIPCYNEEKTLPETLDDLPDTFEGVNEVDILVVDDGSMDNTAEVARDRGVDHLIQFPYNKGLATAFHTGLIQSVRQDADLVVNVDGDNSFKGSEIPRLIQPILQNESDIVIGERKGPNREEFSWTKKILHTIGCMVVRQLSNTDIPDVTCGFRAYSREAALRLNVVSRFTYTLETIIQAGSENLSITSVPIETNPPRRESRLYDSHLDYVRKSMNTIIRMFITYQPLKFFGTLGAVIFTAGFLLGCRYIYLYFMGGGPGHLPSLLLSSVLLISGFLVIITGLVADVVSSNRKLIEEVLYLQRKRDISQHDPSSDPSR